MKLAKIIISALLIIPLLLKSCKVEEPDSSHAPTTSAPTYNPDIANIMYNYCSTCHSSNFPSADLSLGNYDDVKSIAKSGKLLTRINDANNPMPPNGLLSEDKRKLIENWIKNNYPKE